MTALMTDNNTDLQDAAAPAAEDTGASFSERYSEILGTINTTLDQVDWAQVGRIGKGIGVFVVVIVAQVLIKGVLDTINLLPVVPGLLELLGLVVVGQWSWKNLTTSEKRSGVVAKVQSLRKEYLG
jgi:CAAD domains of cyanobacterial aminoacyl-tRNA synthetase